MVNAECVWAGSRFQVADSGEREGRGREDGEDWEEAPDHVLLLSRARPRSAASADRSMRDDMRR